MRPPTCYFIQGKQQAVVKRDCSLKFYIKQHENINKRRDVKLEGYPCKEGSINPYLSRYHLFSLKAPRSYQKANSATFRHDTLVA
jgi:hypothetical protein